jgi:hypothetical protein
MATPIPATSMTRLKMTPTRFALRAVASPAAKSTIAAMIKSISARVSRVNVAPAMQSDPATTAPMTSAARCGAKRFPTLSSGSVLSLIESPPVHSLSATAIGSAI